MAESRFSLSKDYGMDEKLVDGTFGGDSFPTGTGSHNEGAVFTPTGRHLLDSTLFDSGAPAEVLVPHKTDTPKFEIDTYPHAHPNGAPGSPTMGGQRRGSVTEVHDSVDARGGPDDAHSAGQTSRFESQTSTKVRDESSSDTGNQNIKGSSGGSFKEKDNNQHYPPAPVDVPENSYNPNDATFYNGNNASFSERPGLNVTSNTDVFEASTLPGGNDTFSAQIQTPAKQTQRKSYADKHKDLKSNLVAWRPLVVLLMDVLHWKQPWYPAVLIGINTLVFVTTWYMNLSILSLFFLVGIVATAADFAIPLIAPALINTEQWSASDDKRLDEACNWILAVQNYFVYLWVFGQTLRKDMPRATSMGLALIFLSIAWFFAKVNNTVFLYLLTTFLLLAPGMQKAGVLKAAGEFVGNLKTRMITSRTDVTPGRKTK